LYVKDGGGSDNNLPSAAPNRNVNSSTAISNIITKAQKVLPSVRLDIDIATIPPTSHARRTFIETFIDDVGEFRLLFHHLHKS
jgi:hypothetical protein